MKPVNCQIGRSFPSTRVLTIDQIRERQYAAAKSSRMTGEWTPASQDVNSIIRSSSTVVRARLRQLVRDFPYFKKAKSNLVNYTVGTGTNFQSRVLGKETNKNGRPQIDRKLSQQIEDAVAWGMEEIDARWYRGSSSAQVFGEMERMAKGEDVESGESLFIKTLIKDKSRYIPYALMQYESEWLTGVYSDVAKGMETDQGIEFDPKTGRIVAYHFAQQSAYSLSSTSTRSQRIPAEYVIHTFDPLRPGQLRGVSPFVTAVLLSHSLNDYMTSTLEVAKMAAKYLGIIKTPNAAAFQASRTVNGTGSELGKKLEGIENATFEYLKPGEELVFAPQNIPGDQVGPFSQLICRMLAIATDTTYELLTGDYSGLNFSNLKGIRNDYGVMMRPHQSRHITHYTKPVVNDIIEYSVLAGKLQLPNYWQNPRIYQRGLYLPPGMESTDMLRDTKALLDQMRAGLRDPQEIVAARGRDLDEILDNIQEFVDNLKERGLDFILSNIDGLSSAMANNPDTLGADTGNASEPVKKARVLSLTRAINSAVEDAFLMAEGDE